MTAVTIEPVSGDRRKLRWWHMLVPLIVLFLTPAIFAGSEIAYTMLHQGASSPDPLHALLNDPIGMNINMIVSYGLMLLVLWWIARTRGPVPISGYFRRVDARTNMMAAVVGVLLVGVLFVVANILDYTHLVAFHETKIENLLKAHTVRQLVLTLIMAALIGPIAEEIYFRGLFLVWLRQNWSLPVAIIVNAVLFALVHGDMIADPGAQGWIETAGIACVAYVNVMWTVRTGSLWPAFITHGVFNGLQIVVSSWPMVFGHG